MPSSPRTHIGKGGHAKPGCSWRKSRERPAPSRAPDLAGDAMARGIPVAADEHGSEPDLDGQPPRFVHRGGSDVARGVDRAMPRGDQRVQPEIAVLVDGPLAGNLAELAGLEHL